MKDHTRELTFPAVVGLLQDGQWHADGELTAVTTFPQEWLAHLEHEGFLERQGETPGRVGPNLVARRRLHGALFRGRRRRARRLCLLPSLDRLAELIERVVALLDQVTLAPEQKPRGAVAGSA